MDLILSSERSSTGCFAKYSRYAALSSSTTCTVRSLNFSVKIEFDFPKSMLSINLLCLTSEDRRPQAASRSVMSRGDLRSTTLNKSIALAHLFELARTSLKKTDHEESRQDAAH